MKRIFPHITIVLSALCLLLFIIDRFNSNMAFMNNEITRWLVAALSIFAIVTSVRMMVWDLPMNDKEKWKQMHFRQQRKLARREAGKQAAPEEGTALDEALERQDEPSRRDKPSPD